MLRLILAAIAAVLFGCIDKGSPTAAQECEHQSSDASLRATRYRDSSLGKPYSFFKSPDGIRFMMVNPYHPNGTCFKTIFMDLNQYDSLIQTPFLKQFFATGVPPEFKFTDYLYQVHGQLYAQEYIKDPERCGTDSIAVYGPLKATIDPHCREYENTWELI